MALKKLYEATDEFLGLTMRDILQNEGIPVLLQKNEIAGLQFNVGKSAWCWGTLHVDEENYERALELVAAFKGSLGELTEADVEAE